MRPQPMRRRRRIEATVAVAAVMLAARLVPVPAEAVLRWAFWVENKSVRPEETIKKNDVKQLHLDTNMENN